MAIGYKSVRKTKNSSVKYTQLQLLAANWGGGGPYTQTFSIADLTPNTQIDLFPTANLLNQLYNLGVACLYAENRDGVPVIICIGDKPTENFIIDITLQEVTQI